MVEAADTGVVFWLLAAAVLISGFLVVSLKNIFHCAIFLVICLTAVAGIFLLLDAEFLAAAQVLIYVGAVSILMIFAIMLTSRLAAHNVIQTNRHAIIAFFISMVFGLGAIALIAGTHIWRLAIETLPADNIATIGKLLMTEFMLPFEVVSVLLLAAMIGAIVLARKEGS
ncbi:MAG: NADH-quinone oxidoreductase subunit J [Candidatus Zixiibacteriota bacterium]|nr:MAG: NADH-quinone oxidoreductase subunit J [candidate division Zixibacteria bacterium]